MKPQLQFSSDSLSAVFCLSGVFLHTAAGIQNLETRSIAVEVLAALFSEIMEKTFAQTSS